MEIKVKCSKCGSEGVMSVMFTDKSTEKRLEKNWEAFMSFCVPCNQHRTVVTGGEVTALTPGVRKAQRYINKKV